jgi:chromosome segregation ATPase
MGSRGFLQNGEAPAASAKIMEPKQRTESDVEEAKQEAKLAKLGEKIAEVERKIAGKREDIGKLEAKKQGHEEDLQRMHPPVSR